jgi:hypothetical protein
MLYYAAKSISLMVTHLTHDPPIDIDLPYTDRLIDENRSLLSTVPITIPNVLSIRWPHQTFYA